MKPTHRGRPDIDRKIEFLQQHKMEKKAVVFVDTTRYHRLWSSTDIDRSKKKFSMNKAYKYKWSTIMEELEKCVILCANCHRKKTIEDKDYLNNVNKEPEEVRQYDLFGDLV